MSLSSHSPAPMTTTPDTPDREAFEARYALRVTARLSAASEALPQDITERLRVAREQAVGRARSQAARRRAPAGQTAGGLSLLGLGNALGLGRPARGWVGTLGVGCAVAALLLGLSVVEQLQDEDLLLAAAEIDAALLADDLPPDAYSDPGFAAFLRGVRP